MKDYASVLDYHNLDDSCVLSTVSPKETFQAM